MTLAGIPFEDQTNPFLQGNFAPVPDERSCDALQVIGRVPAELDGAFVRNGPNPQFAPLGRYHWFDGDGMLHATSLRDGTATYRNRWIRTVGFEKERAAGRALWTGLGAIGAAEAPPGESLMKNTANTALVWHAGRLLALWEAGPPTAVRMPALDTVGLETFAGQLVSPFTAHPKVCPVTGEMLAFGYGFFPPYVTYYVISPTGEIVHTAGVDIEVPVMMHDFAVTEHHAIFFDLPLTFRLERMAAGGPPIDFEPDRPGRFGIMPRRGANADVRWFEVPSCFVFHSVNAYEDGDTIVLHASRLERTAALQDVTDAPMDPATRAHMHRWRFNLRTGTATEEPLDDATADFGRCDERRMGLRNRYGYAARFVPTRNTPIIDGILKYDYDTGRIQTHVHGPHRFGGEAVFVPRPGGTAEDDGWLMTYVHDERENTDELVVVDARDLPAPPVARVRIPARVPYGFHGLWIGGADLRAQR